MTEPRLDLDVALAAMLDDCRPVTASERVAVADALGRVAAGSVTAPRSLPPFPASAMDGYALRSHDLSGDPPYRLDVAGTSLAGHPFDGTVPGGSAVRLFTGAPVPDGLDAVVIQEDCDADGDRVVIRTRVHPGDHVRPVGHDLMAGGQVIADGRRLTPFDVGWLTACGLDAVEVRGRPRVGLFSTGDELLEPGMPQGPGQIYDANRATLRALLASLPVTIEDFGVVPDDREAIGRTLAAARDACDVVVTSGGVSVGDADWVRDEVERLGTLKFWRLNLKPGKPLAYGRLGDAAFFGLPGNPVSTIVTALLLLKPVLERLCGAWPSPPLRLPARLTHDLDHAPGREEYQRGTLLRSDGGWQVETTGDQSSNRLASFAAADCLVRVPKDSGRLPAGTEVETLPFHGLL